MGDWADHWSSSWWLSCSGTAEFIHIRRTVFILWNQCLFRQKYLQFFCYFLFVISVLLCALSWSSVLCRLITFSQQRSILIYFPKNLCSGGNLLHYLITLLHLVTVLSKSSTKKKPNADNMQISLLLALPLHLCLRTGSNDHLFLASCKFSSYFRSCMKPSYSPFVL